MGRTTIEKILTQQKITIASTAGKNTYGENENALNHAKSVNLPNTCDTTAQIEIINNGRGRSRCRGRGRGRGKRNGNHDENWTQYVMRELSCSGELSLCFSGGMWSGGI